MWPSLAAVLFGCVVLLLLQPRPAQQRLPQIPAGERYRPSFRSPGVQIVVVGVVAAGLVSASAGAVAWLSAGLALLVRARLARKRGQRVDHRQRADRVLEVCSVLAGELTAGQQPIPALVAAAELDPDLLGAAARVASLGGDPTAYLATAAQRPGASALRPLAAAWALAATSGAPPGGLLRTAAVAVRSDLEVVGEVEAALAPTRATAGLLAVLPGIGILMGTALGADPRFLLVEVSGQVCLFGAVCFAGAGMLWLDWLTTRAEVLV